MPRTRWRADASASIAGRTNYDHHIECQVLSAETFTYNHIQHFASNLKSIQVISVQHKCFVRATTETEIEFLMEHKMASQSGSSLQVSDH